MPFPPKPSKKKDDEDFECFAEMIRPIFLRMCLTDMIKMNPYAKYMKEIVTNKRKILEAEISTMLANYTFKGGIPKKLGDPGVPTIPCSIKRNYVKTALCDLGAGVSVMPLSLYLRIDSVDLRLFPWKVYRMLITINMKSDIAFVAINNSPCSIQKRSSKNNRHTIVLGNIKNNKVR